MGTEQLVGSVFSLSCHKYGCRVVQKALSTASQELQSRLVVELESRVLECIENMHANHVIQSCVKCLEPSRIGFVIAALERDAVRMAAHTYGCRVIQRLLERCPELLGGVIRSLLGN